MSKSKVIKYWLENFPGLSKFTGTKLYINIGPIICGIEIVNLPRVKEYRPHFVLYPLYRNTMKECLEYPELMFEIENNVGPGKHNQYNLAFEVESDSAKAVIEDAKNGIGFTFDSPVYLNLVNDLFDNQIAKGIREPDLLEAKYLLNLVIGENYGAEVIEEILARKKKWDMNKFVRFRGDFDIWLTNLKSFNRKELLKAVEINLTNEALTKLNRVELKRDHSNTV